MGDLDGRDSAGRFKIGNAAGAAQRGKPKNKLRAKVRDAWNDVWTEQEVTKVARELLLMATTPSEKQLEAARLGLAYTLGKPGDEAAERLDQLEAILLDLSEDAARRNGRAGIG